jgi:hypothetical protein
MKAPLIYAAICLLSFTACNNSPSPKALSTAEIMDIAGKSPGMNGGKGTFTVKAPDGWTQRDTVISRIEYTFMMPPLQQGSPFQANVNIVTQQLKQGLTLDRYMESTQQELQTFFSDYKEISVGERTVTGVKAKWMKCQYSRQESGLLNIEITVLIKNNIAYAITLTTLANELDKYAPAMEEILGSFAAR